MFFETFYAILPMDQTMIFLMPLPLLVQETSVNWKGMVMGLSVRDEEMQNSAGFSFSLWKDSSLVLACKLRKAYCCCSQARLLKNYPQLVWSPLQSVNLQLLLVNFPRVTNLFSNPLKHPSLRSALDTQEESTSPRVPLGTLNLHWCLWGLHLLKDIRQ